MTVIVGLFYYIKALTKMLYYHLFKKVIEIKNSEEERSDRKTSDMYEILFERKWLSIAGTKFLLFC